MNCEIFVLLELEFISEVLNCVHSGQSVELAQCLVNSQELPPSFWESVFMSYFHFSLRLEVSLLIQGIGER